MEAQALCPKPCDYHVTTSVLSAPLALGGYQPGHPEGVLSGRNTLMI